MIAAAKSNVEWAASAKMPRLPLSRPTTIFKPVNSTAATIELSAALDFSL